MNYTKQRDALAEQQQLNKQVSDLLDEETERLQKLHKQLREFADKVVAPGTLCLIIPLDQDFKQGILDHLAILRMLRQIDWNKLDGAAIEYLADAVPFSTANLPDEVETGIKLMLRLLEHFQA
jgi:hypothetical protein